MKKAILPAVISAALLATSAQAAEIYSNDTTTVSLKGEVDGIYSLSDDGTDTSNSISSWANTQLDISTKISDGVTAKASFEIEANDGEEVKVDDAWVGISGDFGEFKLGETGSSYAILEKAELANEVDDIDVDYSDGEGSGTSIRYQKTFAGLTLSANYFIDDSNSSTESDTDATGVVTYTETAEPIEGFAVSADYTADKFKIGDSMASFTIGAAYIDSGDDVTGLGASTSFATDTLFLATTYSINSKNDNSDDDFYTVAASASYDFGLVKAYGSYQVKNGDYTAVTNNWYVGLSKDVTAKITAFVEYNDQDNDSSLIKSGVYYAF